MFRADGPVSSSDQEGKTGTQVAYYQSDHKYVDMKVGSEGCVLSMRREKEHANGPG